MTSSRFFGGVEQVADGRNRVGRLAPGVGGRAGHLVAEDAAGLVDRVRGAVAGDQVDRAERGVGAAERGDVGEGQGRARARPGNCRRLRRPASPTVSAIAAVIARELPVRTSRSPHRLVDQHLQSHPRGESPRNALHLVRVRTRWPASAGRHRQPSRSTSSATTRLRIVPTPSTVTSITSPGWSQTGGFLAKPTPPGVPVAMTSPGRSLVNDEKNSIALGTSTIIWEVLADCMTWPFSVVVSAASEMSSLVGGDQFRPDRHGALEVLAGGPLRRGPLPLARGRVVEHDEPGDRGHRVARP